ncbi:hypothetical protein V5799_012046 [Amblyomma americanum]|uniref:Uncharacterized protein n=1 Tax=Amblyomma americanum TaxID=6943 RepID=A0AAQ4EFJ5_AMBAM
MRVYLSLRATQSSAYLSPFRMTTADFTALRSLLADLTVEEICSLERVGLTWLPQLRDEPTRNVIDDICDALQALQPLEYRLSCVAYFCSQLIPLKRVKPWHLYRLNPAPTWDVCSTLIESTSTDIRLPGYDATIAWSLCGSKLHGCLLINSLQSPSRGRIPVYVVLWPGQPLFAISSREYSIQCPVVIAVSTALHSRFMKLQGLISDDLDSAYRAAVDLIGSA